MSKNIAIRLGENLRTYYKKVINLSDSPERIAGGVALGLAFDFLPIPVISIPLSYLVARLTRCNPVAAVTTVIFFKLAVPVFYTLNLLTGSFFFGDMPGRNAVDTGVSILDRFLDMLFEHGYPFLAGSLINAVVVWLAVYFLLIFLLERRRRKRGG